MRRMKWPQADIDAAYNLVRHIYATEYDNVIVVPPTQPTAGHSALEVEPAAMVSLLFVILFCWLTIHDHRTHFNLS